MIIHSTVQLEKRLNSEIEEWSNNYDLNTSYDEDRDLVEAIVNVLEEEILEVNNLPYTTEDDEEHYN